MKVVRREILAKALLDKGWYKDKSDFSEEDFNFILNKLGDTYYIIDGMAKRVDYIEYVNDTDKFMKFKENI